MQVATIAWFEGDSVCGSHSVAIPIVLVLPYLFRLFQCLRQYKDTRDKTSLFNGKFPILLSLRYIKLLVSENGWCIIIFNCMWVVFKLEYFISALKYSTAVPVIFVSALQYHVFPDKWVNLYRPLWLVSAVVNCLYSFYWDLTRDWDLRWVN